MAYLPCVEIEPKAPADTSLIVLHGIGASGHDFEALVPELNLPPHARVRFLFPHAPTIPVTISHGLRMPAWYDILGIHLERKLDENQLLASAEAVADLIGREIERGVESEQIVVAGFSQGGSVAYQAALTYPKPLGGLIGLSTYLATYQSLKIHPANRALPTLICHGRMDRIVPEPLGRRSYQRLVELGLEPDYRTYPIGHTVSRDELQDISEWMSEHLELSPA